MLFSLFIFHKPSCLKKNVCERVLSIRKFSSDRHHGLIVSHSLSQRPGFSWSAPRIATSAKVQNRKSAIHGLPVTLRMLGVKSDKSEWLRTRNDYSAHATKIGLSQRSRFLVLTERARTLGRKNVSLSQILSGFSADELYHVT